MYTIHNYFILPCIVDAFSKRGCASGSGENIFGNKYGQYLAAIQIARENRKAMKEAARQENEDDEYDIEENENNDDDDENDDDEDEEEGKKNIGKKRAVEEDTEEDYKGPVGAADGSSGSKVNSNIWAANEEEDNIELSEEMIGELAGDARQEAMLAVSKSKVGLAKGGGPEEAKGPPGKRVRAR